MSKERNGRISCRGIRKRGERGGGKDDGDRWVEREGEQGGDESTGLPAKPSFYLVGSVTGVQMPRPASPKSHFSYSILFPLFLPPYRFHSRSFRAVCVCSFAPLPPLCPDRTARNVAKQASRPVSAPCPRPSNVTRFSWQIVACLYRTPRACLTGVNPRSVATRGVPSSLSCAATHPALALADGSQSRDHGVRYG